MTTEAMFENLQARTLIHFQNIPPEYVNEQVLLDILPILFHKLKNKLTPIMGYSQILKANSRNDFFNSRLEKIEENASDLSELLNTLKDYFQFAKKAKQRGNLNRTLKKLDGLFLRIGKEQNVRVRIELDPKVPDDFYFSGEIETLILNLVDNAVTAVKMKTPAGKSILIRTEDENDQYRLRIRDDGIGIAEEEQGKIWAPFSAASKTGRAWD